MKWNDRSVHEPEHKQYALPWADWKGCYGVSMCWSARTTLQSLRTSTVKVVCAPVACYNSPAISSFGVRSIWGRFEPFMSLVCSTVWPTSSHELRCGESGDSTPRGSNWFGESVRWSSGRPVCLARNLSLPVVLLPVHENTLYRCTGAQVARGLRKYAFPPVILKSGRSRNRSCYLHPIGPIGPGSQNSRSSRQPLPGESLWGRTFFLRDGAPFGTRVQTSGNSMSGPWTACGGSMWITPWGT